MNLGRETIFAGVAGFALGLLAAWAVWSIPQITSKKEVTPTTVQEEAAPEPTEVFTLTLTQPEDEAILANDKVQVLGKTTVGATVVVSGPLGDEVVEAGSTGTFSATVKLEEGTNEIVVTAYPPGSEIGEKTETRTVSYTTEEF